MAEKEKKSLSDLAKLTEEAAAPAETPETEAPAEAEATAESEASADAEAPAEGAEAPAEPVEAAVEAPAAPEAAPMAREGREGGRDRDGRREKPEETNKDGVETQGPQIQAILREQQLDKQGRAYATGRRKDAVARVWLKPGTGKIVVNGRDQEV